ncbi:MAG: peroxiredoxin [Rhodomicrobium sp.]|nr:peroxiredoxin [Rhodomicrobium sp.]
MSPAPSIVSSVKFQVMVKGQPASITSGEVFPAEKSVALFGLPGAFTPSCHHVHLPEIIAEYGAYKASGVDLVACTAVNDVFVLDAWVRALGVTEEILFLADGNGDFARSLGLLFDARPLGLGWRSRRYAMWVKNGSIQHLAVEPDPTLAEVSSAYSLLRVFESWSEGKTSAPTFD